MVKNQKSKGLGRGIDALFGGNFDSIENSCLNPEISEKWFENHLNCVYSGRPRHCTILTENEN